MHDHHSNHHGPFSSLKTPAVPLKHSQQRRAANHVPHHTPRLSTAVLRQCISVHEAMQFSAESERPGRRRASPAGPSGRAPNPSTFNRMHAGSATCLHGKHSAAGKRMRKLGSSRLDAHLSVYQPPPPMCLVWISRVRSAPLHGTKHVLP